MSIQFAMPPAQKPAKKRKKWPFVVGGLVVLLIVIIVSSNSGGTSTPQPTGTGTGNELSSAAQAPASQQAPAQPQAAAEHTVLYKVTGTAKASSITYTTDGMTSSNQESEVTLPWQKTIKLPTGEALQMVSILAQGSGKGTITATIEVDGKIVKQASADGYGIAMANGNIGELGG